MRTRQLSDAIDASITTLGAEIAPLATHRALSPRFDRQLFHAKSTLMGDYLDEIKENWRQLKRHITAQNTPQTAWLAEHLVAQITALSREAATWSLRTHDGAHLAVSGINEKLLQHQDFERRLMAMKNARTAQLLTENTFAGQQRLLREIDALDGRLERCRNALVKITQALERRIR